MTHGAAAAASNAAGLAFGFLLALAAPGLASGEAGAAGPGAGSIAGACQLDVQLFCPDLDRESPMQVFVECLLEERDALTAECGAAVDPGSAPRRHRPGRGPVADACGEDFRRVCGHENDRMGFARCVHNRREQFSNECRQALNATRPGAGGSGPGGSSPGGSGPGGSSPGGSGPEPRRGLP